MRGLERLLGLPGSLAGRALRLWLLLLTLTAAFELGSGTVLSLFLEQAGGAALPPAFVLEAVLRLLATGVYLALTRLVSFRLLMVLSSLGYAMSVAAVGVMGEALGPGLFPLFYALERVAFELAMLHWGVYLVDFFSVGESAAAFPFIYSAQTLGTVVSGVVMATFPGSDVRVLLVAAVVLAGAGAWLCVRSDRWLTAGARVPVSAPAGVGAGGRKAAWQYVRRSRVVLWMGVATAGLVVLRDVLGVSYNLVIEQEYGQAVAIERFLGRYSLIASLAAFVVQAVLASRLTRRLSPTRVNLAYSWFAVAAFGGMLLFPGLGAAVFARSVDREVKSILKTPFSVMMYGAMADYARAQARIMVFGIVIPAASFLGGLGLMALGAYDLSVFAVALAGLLLSLVFVGVTRRQNRAYVEALLEMLEAKVGAAAAGASAAVCGIAERVRGRCPGWAGRLPGLVAAALADGRVDVLDNAAEAVCAVVPVREGVALREAVEGGAKRVAKG